MTKETETLKLALVALESDHPDIQLSARITLRAVLADPPLPVQPVQKPVGHLHSNGDFCQTANLVTDSWPVSLYTTPPQPEDRNFCQRCGKRTAFFDLTAIHTCTPPRGQA